jgi:hypothetical protein
VADGVAKSACRHPLGACTRTAGDGRRRSGILAFDPSGLARLPPPDRERPRRRRGRLWGERGWPPARGADAESRHRRRSGHVARRSLVCGRARSWAGRARLGRRSPGASPGKRHDAEDVLARRPAARDHPLLGCRRDDDVPGPGRRGSQARARTRLPALVLAERSCPRLEDRRRPHRDHPAPEPRTPRAARHGRGGGRHVVAGQRPARIPGSPAAATGKSWVGCEARWRLGRRRRLRPHRSRRPPAAC